MTKLIPLSGEKFTDEEIAVFEQKYLTIFKNLAEMVKAKKDLEAKEKEIKAQLEKSMDEHGIKSLDNEFIKFTRIPANEGKTTIDLKKLEEKEPELFKELLADYPTITGAKKAYVKFETK